MSIFSFCFVVFAHALYLRQVFAFSYAQCVLKRVVYVVMVPGDVVESLSGCNLNIERRQKFHCESKVPKGTRGMLGD